MTAAAIDERAQPTLHRFLRLALPSFVLSLALTAACYFAAGPGLGLYLGGLAWRWCWRAAGDGVSIKH